RADACRQQRLRIVAHRRPADDVVASVFETWQSLRRLRRVKLLERRENGIDACRRPGRWPVRTAQVLEREQGFARAEEAGHERAVNVFVDEPLGAQPVFGFVCQRLLDEDGAAVVELDAPVRVDASVAPALDALLEPNV